MYFKSEPRRIDYILAWSTEGKPEKLAHSKEARAVFEENLEKEGLKLERDEVSITDHHRGCSVCRVSSTDCHRAVVFVGSVVQIVCL